MKNIQNEITRGLVGASAGYGRAGLALTRYMPGLGHNPQAAIGNLSIAIELLLKAFIAKRSLLLLFKNLPLELRCALSAPAFMPQSFRSLPYEIELKSSAYISLELDEAIAAFSAFSPDIKKRLSSHLRFLSRHRNTCLHAVHPDCREYEVDRTVFLFLTLVEHLKQDDPELTNRMFIGEEEKNRKFLASFDEERLNRVHGKIEQAREKAKKLTEKLSLGKPVEWDWYPIECPVCGSDGVLSGETTAKPEYDEDGLCGGLLLSFAGETFECEQCGLSLEDYEELCLARIDPEVDRSDEAGQWEEDHYNDYD